VEKPARKQLELANDAALELAGSEDAVLRALLRAIDCSVFLQGNVLTLDGPERAVRPARRSCAVGRPRG
jgi:phosphate starvation-inducible PhoH-like protein